MIEFKLPSLGAEMDEGTLLEWKVKPGDPVKKGDVVAVVDTSKSAIDVEIWETGTIWELVHQPQEVMPVGTVIARLLEPGETPEHAQAEKRRKAAEMPSRVPTGPAPVSPPRAPARPASEAPASRVRISPAARKRAAEVGLDIAAIPGTGPEGTVTIGDVEKAAAAHPPKDRGAEMRRAIGSAMARSKREIPHYYLATGIPLARAVQWLAARNQDRPVTERLLMAVPLLKAVAVALRKYPEFNGFFQQDRFVPGAGAHIGVAISLRQGGLIAPALHDVDAMNLVALMHALADLVARARALTLRSSEMNDATITVTNLGDEGVELVQGIIYPPQVALVGFGRVAERPWVENGQVVVIPVVTASLAADHRASDGHRGAMFLAEIARLLQAPDKLDTTNP